MSDEKTSAEKMRHLINIAQGKSEMPFIDQVFITIDEKQHLLQESKLISGRFNRNIRIDTANYGAGQIHAHLHGRRGDEYGIVNIDGTASHGMKCRLHNKDADALRSKGFNIPSNNIVEWISLEMPGLQFLLG